MFDRLRAKLDPKPTAEDDVRSDPGVARTRETGGADRDDGDSASTTGTGESEEFVGRVSGQDEGSVGQTGAEARAEAGEH